MPVFGHRCSDLGVCALLVEGVVLVKSVVGGEGDVLDATKLNLQEEIDKVSQHLAALRSP